MEPGGMIGLGCMKMLDVCMWAGRAWGGDGGGDVEAGLGEGTVSEVGTHWVGMGT